jgi:hypothetical protein
MMGRQSLKLSDLTRPTDPDRSNKKSERLQNLSQRLSLQKQRIVLNMKAAKYRLMANWNLRVPKGSVDTASATFLTSLFEKAGITINKPAFIHAKVLFCQASCAT